MTAALWVSLLCNERREKIASDLHSVEPGVGGGEKKKDQNFLEQSIPTRLLWVFMDLQIAVCDIWNALAALSMGRVRVDV